MSRLTKTYFSRCYIPADGISTFEKLKAYRNPRQPDDKLSAPKSSLGQRRDGEKLTDFADRLESTAVLIKNKYKDNKVDSAFSIIGAMLIGNSMRSVLCQSALQIEVYKWTARHCILCSKRNQNNHQDQIIEQRTLSNKHSRDHYQMHRTNHLTASAYSGSRSSKGWGYTSRNRIFWHEQSHPPDHNSFTTIFWFSNVRLRMLHLRCTDCQKKSRNTWAGNINRDSPIFEDINPTQYRSWSVQHTRFQNAADSVPKCNSLEITKLRMGH